ncbi:hypothetical protein [Pseudactinotalea sp. Z1748]|uniref:hypothetical protein n=1 Tax=Pseudactinotalea sp. Z1748 TaxID=3413027 RepID=UPI003C7AE254
MAQHADPSADRSAPHTRATVLLGFDLLRNTGALLRHHWLPLTLIALAAHLAQHYLMELVILIARAGAVPGLLALSLVPFVPMLAVVGMLLVLRRRSGHASPLADLMAAVAAVLVPFLVVYQSGGGLEDDMRAYVSRGFDDDVGRTEDLADLDTVSRLPVAESVTVLLVVFTAVLVRVTGIRLVRTRTLWRSNKDRRRMGLQVVVGYAEIVWIVLGAYVVTYVASEFRAWWSGRQVAQWLRDIGGWIEGFWPAFGLVAPAALEWTQLVLAGAVTAILVPVSWLAIGVIVYGVQATDVVGVQDLIRLRRTSAAFARVAARVGMAPIVRAWKLLGAADGRFTALIGATAMILKAGWTPVLTFCLAYVSISQLHYLVWGVAGRVAPPLDGAQWRSLSAPIAMLNDTLVLILSTALLAASADALLTKFGAPSWLRLPPRSPTWATDLARLPRPEPAELLSGGPPRPVPPPPPSEPARPEIPPPATSAPSPG